MKRTDVKRIQRALITSLKRMNIEIRNTKLNCLPPRTISCPCLLSRAVHTIRNTASMFCLQEATVGKRHNLIHMQCLLQYRAASTNPDKPLENIANNLSNVCACPPCGNPACLPPPCNTPAKCLQNMTGYYYYPYGTWFCGPYHVATGPCGPNSGPVKSGGPCGPSPPNPGGPCGPGCVGPCSACGPLSCCGVCGGFKSKDHKNTQSYNQWQSWGSVNMYDQYYTNYGQYNPYYPYNYYDTNAYFGSYYNVPVNPTPVTSPQVQSPKSSISWPQSSAKITEVLAKNTPPKSIPCSKNLTPKSLRFSPPSSYDTKPYFSKTSPKKHRFDARTIYSNSIGICYYSTNTRNYLNKIQNISEIKTDGKIDTSRDELISNWYISSMKRVRQLTTKYRKNPIMYTNMYSKKQ